LKMATIDDIIQRAQQVRDNTAIGSNTATLVGGVMTDTAEHLKEAENGFGKVAASAGTRLYAYTEDAGAITANGTIGTSNAYTHGLIAVSEGETYIIENYSTTSDNVRYAFATAIPVQGSAIQKVGDIGNVNRGTKKLVEIPSGCAYLVWNAGGYSSKIYSTEPTETLANNTPFLRCAYKGISSNFLELDYTNKKRLCVILDTANLSAVKAKDGYRLTAVLFEDSLPTAKFVSISSPTPTESLGVDIKKAVSETTTINPNKVIVGLSNTSDTTLESVYSVDEMVDIVYDSIPTSLFQQENVTTKTFPLVIGALSTSTGGNNPSPDYMLTQEHTSRYIRFTHDIKFGSAYKGYVHLYDENKNYVGNVGISTINGVLQKNKNAGEFVRFAFSNNGADLPPNGIELTSVWDEEEPTEALQMPSDEGFTNICFPVRVTRPTLGTALGVQEQYVQTFDYGVLHLPPSYDPKGRPTPLILFLHGASEVYTRYSVRFGDHVRYSPEWSAMGYAQLDVNMIPYTYSLTQANTSGVSDDVECIVAAYEWVVAHYNIRTDGVYLFGRSRGGMAVLNVLSRYNPTRMPILCALSNAGANTMLNYGLFRRNPTQAWWNAFCTSMGLSTLNPPAVATNTTIVKQPSIVSFLRTNINVWWQKANVAMAMMIDNPTAYQTPTEIFDLLVSSYNDTDEGKTWCNDFVRQCIFRSPVPLRFDYCIGDSIQDWDAHPWGNYGKAGMDAFLTSSLKRYANCVWREWPSCTGGEPHYHEIYNLVSSYTMPNGVVVTDASMAQIEWLLWAMRYDARDLA